LDICENGLGKNWQEIKYLKEALEKNKSIKQLNLQNNNFTEEVENFIISCKDIKLIMKEFWFSCWLINYIIKLLEKLKIRYIIKYYYNNMDNYHI